MNHPDDIRQYDNDPRSPYYDDSKEVAIDNRAEEIAADPFAMMDAIQGDEEKVFEFIKAMCQAFQYPIESEAFLPKMHCAWRAWDALAEDCAIEEIKEENKHG